MHVLLYGKSLHLFRSNNLVRTHIFIFRILDLHSVNITVLDYTWTGPNIADCSFGGLAIIDGCRVSLGILARIEHYCDSLRHMSHIDRKKNLPLLTSCPYVMAVAYSFWQLSGFNFTLLVQLSDCIPIPNICLNQSKYGLNLIQTFYTVTKNGPVMEGTHIILLQRRCFTIYHYSTSLPY